MMKKFFSWFLVVCAALCVVSCESLEDTFSYEQEGTEITITAKTESYGPESRTARLNDGSVEWSPKDSISVFFRNDNNGGTMFVSQNTKRAAIADFKGNIEDLSAGGNPSGDRKVYGVYPYSYKTQFKDGVVTLNLSSQQVSQEGTFADNLFPTVGRGEDANLQFYNVCGGIKFSVTRNDITSITFRGNKGERLAGTVKVSFDSSGRPVVLAEEVESEDEITLYAPEGGKFQAGKDYFIVAFPTDLPSGFTMKFRTADTKEGSLVYNKPVNIERSFFGVLKNADSKISSWTDYTTIGGGFNSGIYLGITCFNEALYEYPVYLLSASSADASKSFIDRMTMKGGTSLYYSVDEAINRLQSTKFPSDVTMAAIVTFTDGLDEGSLMWKPSYVTERTYLAAVNMRIKQEKVAHNPITAFSIGLTGGDVPDPVLFKDNLEKLSHNPKNPNSNDYAYEVKNMSEVKAKFKDIAERLSESNYLQTLQFAIPGKGDGSIIRFTLDNVSKAENSQCYIQGRFNLKERSLENIEYHGLTSSSGLVVNGSTSGIFVTFNFNEVKTNNNVLIKKENVKEWHVTESGSWQKNSEFEKYEHNKIITKYSSAVIMLILDCSSSLAGDFQTVQSISKEFIDILYNASPTLPGNTPGNIPVSSITLSQKSATLSIGQELKLTAAILPSDATDKTIIWSSSNSSVAKVENGTVKALGAGVADITAKAGDVTAVCKITVTAPTVAVSSITLNEHTATLTVGSQLRLTTTIQPSNATDKNVTWSSSDSNIAKVENGLVTALKAGQTEISATAGGKTDKCVVSVNNPVIKVSSVTLSQTSATLTQGDELRLTANVQPSDATNKTVVWTSSNSSIASVSNGVVKAISPGTAIINAQVDNCVAKCDITVKAKSSSIVNGDIETFTVNGVTFDMIRVDGGSFQMGSFNGGNDELPVHSETVNTFSIGSTEVTQALWEAVMGYNPSEFKGPQRPVEMVSWNDCQTFVSKLNSLTGRNFRLPTEAEWEYAARGGTKSMNYPDYAGSRLIDYVAWYIENSGSTTHPVAQKLDNELGIYDMSGNVWEWCSDNYSSSYSSLRNSSYRVFRGGSWGDSATRCRVAYRNYYSPGRRNNGLGLRLAL